MQAANDNQVTQKEKARTSTDAPKMLAVYSIRDTDRGSVWTRCGRAYINRDGSMNVYLETLPVGGRLHIRIHVPPAEASAGQHAA